MLCHEHFLIGYLPYVGIRSHARSKSIDISRHSRLKAIGICQQACNMTWQMTSSLLKLDKMPIFMLYQLKNFVHFVHYSYWSPIIYFGSVTGNICARDNESIYMHWTMDIYTYIVVWHLGSSVSDVIYVWTHMVKEIYGQWKFRWRCIDDHMNNKKREMRKSTIFKTTLGIVYVS